MSEKEKKAIESLIEIREFANLSSYKDTKISQLNAIDVVLNLIEKQSKEIEELKVINQMQKYRIEVIDERELISKDKIKAKIEEYKNKIKKIRNKKLINEPEDTINITRYVHYISVLQSLLEKE